MVIDIWGFNIFGCMGIQFVNFCYNNDVFYDVLVVSNGVFFIYDGVCYIFFLYMNFVVIIIIFVFGVDDVFIYCKVW